MNTSPPLSPSLEDYLETIYLLEKSTASPRITDIADTLHVTMPSVVGALKILKGKGYLHYEKTEPIILTDEGTVIAQSVHKRHRILANFLEHIVLLPPREADAAACRIEHILNPDTAVKLENITLFLDQVRKTMKISPEAWEAIISGSSNSTS